jgi:hypothetical protein
MPGLGVRHVRPTSLEAGLGTRYVWLTREKAERSYMSGLGAGHVQSESLEPDRSF